MNDAPASGNVQTVLRAMRLLSGVTPARQTLTELAATAGVAVPTALRLLRTLESAGYVSRAADGSYGAGPELLRLTYTLDRHGVLGSLVRETLEDLRDVCDETTAFFVRDRDELLCVESAESTRLVRRVYPHAHRVPLHVGTAGKVFLTYGDTEEVIAAVKDTVGPTFTRATGTTHELDDLRAVAIATRRRGYSVSIQEFTMESWGVSAPVYLRSQLIGALTIGIPISRPPAGTQQRLGRACRDAAAALTARLSAGVELGSDEGAWD